MYLDLIEVFVPLPLAAGFVFSLFAYCFYPLQHKLQNHRWRKIGVILLISLLPTILIFGIYTRGMIAMIYSLGIPSSQNWDVKTKYEEKVVTEAFTRTMIPPPFRRKCYSAVEAVCQLANGVVLDVWDLQFDVTDLPLISGLIAGATSSIVAWQILSAPQKSLQNIGQ